MLTIIHQNERITVSLTGRLVGSCAEDLRFATYQATALDIDLSGLTFVDREGDRSLVWLRNMGATFHGDGLFAGALCRRVRIPLPR
jgi:anti-anti-sigma regulatory factor